MSVLTEEDFERLRKHGLPIDVRQRPDLAHDCGEGRIVFTVKGIAYYKEACRMRSLPCDLTEVVTASDAARIAHRVGMVDFRALQKRMIDKRASMDPRNRELADAVCSGSFQDIMDAVDRRKMSKDAGGYVVPVRFK